MNSGNTFRFTVGALECLAIEDGRASVPVSDLIRAEPPEALEPVLRAQGYSTPNMVLAYNCLYVQAGPRRVLIDAGLGPDDPERDRILQEKYKIRRPQIERSGTVLDHLQAAGVAPGDIDTIVITHGDGDHVGGIASPQGELFFPNARYVLPKEAWDFWSDDALQAQWPPILIAAGRAVFPLIRDRLEVLEAGVEFLPGFSLVAAPGHRPGHSGVVMTSEGEWLVHLADAVAHPILMAHPSWRWAIDSSPEQAARDRTLLLGLAAARQALVFAAHLPFPGLGHLEPAGDGWRWLPLAADRS